MTKKILEKILKKILRYFVIVGFCVVIISTIIANKKSYGKPLLVEPVQACIIPRNAVIDEQLEDKIAKCLGFKESPQITLCRGEYSPIIIKNVPDGAIRLAADDVSLRATGESVLKGNVVVAESSRVVNAETAKIYRDPKTNQITEVILTGGVKYYESDKLIIGKKATLYPNTKAGRVEDILYRVRVERSNALLPAWGRAALVERFANEDLLLKRATYTTCSPKNRVWEIDADSIKLDNEKGKGIAKNATLKFKDVPLIYAPRLSFPTRKTRKSGFLMPIVGYTNISGFNLGTPFYWNIAPNYDATIVPAIYTKRGVSLGGEFRYLTPFTKGGMSGMFLPNDKAFRKFISEHEDEFPFLQRNLFNRWMFQAVNSTMFSPNLSMNIDFKQVSDDYFLQDFTANLSFTTQNQLLRQGDLKYTSDHWQVYGMLQSYQTLHPINQTPVSSIYERLPEVKAIGYYDDLPLNSNLDIIGQFDYYNWPGDDFNQPQGARYHLNPILSTSFVRPWGYFTPSVQFVTNSYQLHYDGNLPNRDFNLIIPRYSVDTGLNFERHTSWFGHGYTQTLEPRLYYLNVPYHNQDNIPVFDSAYMIFYYDQSYK